MMCVFVCLSWYLPHFKNCFLLDSDMWNLTYDSGCTFHIYTTFLVLLTAQSSADVQPVFYSLHVVLDFFCKLSLQKQQCS